MDARLDTGFEIWGGFGERPDGTDFIHGRLRYDPAKGIELELVENPHGAKAFRQAGGQSFETLYGQLLDGTFLTLKDCWITTTSFGGGCGSPTKIFVNRALIGSYFPGRIDDLEVKEYSIELSSLSTWTCASPSKITMAEDNGKFSGYDEMWRYPSTINVPLSDGEFDLAIRHRMTLSHDVCSNTTKWGASVSILAHGMLKLSRAAELAWQARNLFSLLVGDRVSIRSVGIEVPNAPGSSAKPISVTLLFHQIGKHDAPDVHAPMMLLPYDLVKDKFETIVQKWFSRHQQAVLAANVFFASDNLHSQGVNVRFLVVVQALESYHRSLGTGLYMDKAEFDKAIREVIRSLPASIQGDHMESLKSRLKYGNEYSLRKRLREMLARIPDDVRSRVTGGDVARFVSRIADTRNYYTHFDQASAGNVLQPKDVYAATERLRILVVANLLSDLGIADEHLLTFLARNAEFQHSMDQELPL